MSPPTTDDGSVPARLRAALADALKGRDMVAASALRSALAAIGNAEAVDPASPPAGRVSSEHFAASVTGLGAGEAERHSLSEADVTAIVEAEIAERLSAAGEYERAGHPARADRLRREAHILVAALIGYAPG